MHIPSHILIPTFAISLVVVLAVTGCFFVLAAPSQFGDVAAVERRIGPSVDSTGASGSATWEVAASEPALSPSPPAPLAIPVWSGLLSRDGSTGESIVPVRLRVDAIDVDAPVVGAGVNGGTGQMDVPDNAYEVAWYEPGPRPGESGSAVLAAHVDLAGRGPGVFFDLEELDRGDLVQLEFSDGSISRFRVEAGTIYQKAELPLETIFAREGAPVLTLITCGGAFSESAGSYDSNVVVYAIPIPDRDLSDAS